MKGVEVFQEMEDLFIDENVFTHKYIPEELPGRDEQIEELAYHLRPALKGKAPSNLLIYGKTGTGKTVVTDYVLRHLKSKAEEQGVIEKIRPLYVSCPQAPTETQLLQYIINAYSSTSMDLYGWGVDKYYQVLKKVLSGKKGVFVLVLDEIDKLKTDTVLYNLTRLSIEGADISIIGISNNLRFMETLDPRVKSSFGEEQIVFPPYNANQLITILRQRVELGVKPSAVSNPVISLCAAIAAQHEGDARKAIDLLRVSIQMAEKERKNKVEEDHVKKAILKIEMDRIKSVVTSAPLQQKVVLLAILLNEERGKHNTTGEIYETYKDLCRRTSLRVSTMKWVTDIINEFHMLGIVDARVVSMGRFGRTTKVTLGAPLRETKEILLSDPLLACLKEDNQIHNKQPGYFY
ncbi:MAG: orc1/cdc6 family replication initiation protein [Thermoplasmata archaeon]